MDPFSATLGFADRIYWGWKTIDFANGTAQGAVHSLAILYKHRPNENQWLLTLIDQMIRATPKIIRSNGSAEEAYPQENSFCVTALVAFDLLSAIDIVGDQFEANAHEDYLEIIRPLIIFITNNGEEHAIISNHLATGVAAIVLWNKLARENSTRHQELLSIIYANQSEEGWYKEYEGADPGYQTLCTYYLASAYLNTRDEELKLSLLRSAKFLKDLMHPDGSIGGLYGSRNTEVYYPGGIVALAKEFNEFAFLARHLAEGLKKGNHLLPDAIDANNFIPLLNSYAFASYHFSSEIVSIETEDLFYNIAQEKKYPHAGLFLKSTPNYFCILNFKKGGVIKLFNKKNRQLEVEDGGLFGELSDGTKFSTQQLDNSTEFIQNSFRSSFYKINESYPGLFQTMVIRIFALTIFKSVFLGNLFKKAIVQLLMTGKNRLKGVAHTTIWFHEDHVEVIQKLEKPNKCTFVGHVGKAKAIHMASSGYFIKPVFKINPKSTYIKYLLS